MRRRVNTNDLESVLLTIGALVTGFAVGWFFSSPRGNKARARISDQAAKSSQWLDDQLLHAKERVLAAGDDAAEHLRSAVEETVEKVVPQLGSEADWEDVFAKTAKDIRKAGK